ncbi:hypothetical protein MSAN_00432600 [Mycena sanguinolenta]|uniref:Uncharacterized protein n=1 Tax=Mycena sanguinolenta TaxID=230812 RepID=A0A8H7DJD4_9AGAR|nr:hypothetical protein MSAN_00432600 [Mycena sanguinolenta]
MENTVLSAKSSGQWTGYELEVLNISIEEVDAPDFLGSALRDPQTDPILLAHSVLLSNETHPAGPISRENGRFFRYLQDVARFADGPFTEMAITDFCACLLQLLDYDEPECVVHRYDELDMIMCGERVNTTSNVVVMDDDQNHLLLLQVDLPDAEAEPQLIAAAIAAYYHSNRHRQQLGLPTVKAKVFPGIVMTGSAPTFYLIPVSEALEAAVRRGQYPSEPTVVKKLRPTVNDMREYLEKGMESLANRQLIFQLLGAFKQFLQ